MLYIFLYLPVNHLTLGYVPHPCLGEHSLECKMGGSHSSLLHDSASFFLSRFYALDWESGTWVFTFSLPPTCVLRPRASSSILPALQFPNAQSKDKHTFHIFCKWLPRFFWTHVRESVTKTRRCQTHVYDNHLSNFTSRKYRFHMVHHFFFKFFTM